ncbi:hypothetical protein EYV94_11995 [Puteibacter caeruleilacunae]|nr:hypothetical protein EYV94_11995 [Puteibacter caeruleilacunae]
MRAKIYLDNSNLAYTLVDEVANTGIIRETFFINQLRVKYIIAESTVSDFVVEDMTFEVGGKNKTQRQIRNVSDSYVVKDDIENGFGNVIPLWQFGMMY